MLTTTITATELSLLLQLVRKSFLVYAISQRHVLRVEQSGGIGMLILAAIFHYVITNSLDIKYEYSATALFLWVKVREPLSLSSSGDVLHPKNLKCSFLWEVPNMTIFITITCSKSTDQTPSEILRRQCSILVPVAWY